MEQNKIDYILVRKKVKRLNLRVKSDGAVYVSAPIRAKQEDIDAFVESCRSMIEQAKQRFQKLIEERHNLYPKLQFVNGERVYMLGRFYPLFLEEVCRKKEERAWFNGQNITIYVMPGHTYELRKRLFERMWRLYSNKIYTDLVKNVQVRFLQSPYGQNNPSKVTLKELRIRDMKSRWGSCMPQRKIITLNSRLLSFAPIYIEYVIIHEFAHFVEANHSPRFHAVVTHFLPQWPKLKRELNEQGSLIYG